MKISGKIEACLLAAALAILCAGCETTDERIARAEASMFPAELPHDVATNVFGPAPRGFLDSAANVVYPGDKRDTNTTDEVIQYDRIILRAGDVIKVSIPSTPSLTGTHLIRRDGNITLDMVGELRAAGKSLDALKADLIKAYSDKIDTKEFNVELESSRFPIYVTGAVGHPGKLESDHPITALEAIMESGGFDYSRANLKEVRIFRLQKGKYVSMTINLKAVMRGVSSETVFLKPQDIVYVKEHFTWF